MSPSPKCTLFLTISFRRKQKSGFILAAAGQRVMKITILCFLSVNEIRTPSSLGWFCSSSDLLLTRCILNNGMSFIEETWGFRKSSGGVTLLIMAYTGRPSSSISDYFPSSCSQNKANLSRLRSWFFNYGRLTHSLLEILPKNAFWS